MIERIGMDHDKGKSLAGDFVVDFDTAGGAVHQPEHFRSNVQAVQSLRSVQIVRTVRFSASQTV
jgi:hypothetical protein